MNRMTTVNAFKMNEIVNLNGCRPSTWDDIAGHTCCPYKRLLFARQCNFFEVDMFSVEKQESVLSTHGAVSEGVEIIWNPATYLFSDVCGVYRIKPKKKTFSRQLASLRFLQARSNIEDQPGVTCRQKGSLARAISDPFEGKLEPLGNIAFTFFRIICNL